LGGSGRRSFPSARGRVNFRVLVKSYPDQVVETIGRRDASLKKDNEQNRHRTPHLETLRVKEERSEADVS
jgi:hypothetical protein